MNQKGITPIVIILIIVGILAIGGTVWYYQKIIQSFSLPASQPPAPQDETANWKIYQYDGLVFQVKYPNQLAFIHNGAAGDNEGIFFDSVIFTTQEEFSKYQEIKEQERIRCAGVDFCTATPFAVKGFYLDFYFDRIPEIAKYEGGEVMYKDQNLKNEGFLSQCLTGHTNTYLGLQEVGNEYNFKVKIYKEKIDEKHYVLLCATEGFEKTAEEILKTVKIVTRAQ